MKSQSAKVTLEADSLLSASLVSTSFACIKYVLFALLYPPVEELKIKLHLAEISIKSEVLTLRVYSATKVFLFFFFNPKNTDVAQNPNRISVAASCPSHPSLDFMQTRSQSSKGSSSPPQSISSLSAANAPGNLAPVVHHNWTTEEEQALIDFLAEHASEAGNGATSANPDFGHRRGQNL